MRLPREFNNRSAPLTLLRHGRYLRVRLLLPEAAKPPIFFFQQGPIPRILTGEEDFLTAQQQSCLYLLSSASSSSVWILEHRRIRCVVLILDATGRRKSW